VTRNTTWKAFSHSIRADCNGRQRPVRASGRITTPSPTRPPPGDPPSSRAIIEIAQAHLAPSARSRRSARETARVLELTGTTRRRVRSITWRSSIRFKGMSECGTRRSCDARGGAGSVGRPFFFFNGCSMFVGFSVFWGNAGMNLLGKRPSCACATARPGTGIG